MPWPAASQAPLSMEFSRQEYWSRLPFPPPGDIPDPMIKYTSLVSPALAGGFFTNVPPGRSTLQAFMKPHYSQSWKPFLPLVSAWSILGMAAGTLPKSALIFIRTPPAQSLGPDQQAGEEGGAVSCLWAAGAIGGLRSHLYFSICTLRCGICFLQGPCDHFQRTVCLE